MTGPIRVLFVCTGNSARSVMAEALLRDRGGDAFEAFSAGTEPRGVNPLTLDALREEGIEAGWARSRSVLDFLGQPFDYVITVCDDAKEACPVFPGEHRSVHWSFQDPAAATGSDEERRAVFRRILAEIRERIDDFVADAGRAAR